MDNKKKYPSALKQMSNLFTAATDVAKGIASGNVLYVPEQVKQQRLKLCVECEWYDPEQVRCKACGCFLEQKTSFAQQTCPHNKWEAYIKSE